MEPSPASALLLLDQVPGPKGRLVVGSLPEMRRDPLSLLMRAAREHGDVARLDLVERTLLLSHPDDVKHVLQDRHVDYGKSYFYERLKLLAGEGLVTSEGAFWLRQRRLAAPAFHRERIGRLQSMMARRTGEMLERWRGLEGAESFDVAREMTRLTLGIAGESLFGMDLIGAAEEVGDAAATALEITNQRGNQLVLFPQAIPTPQNRRFKKALKVLDGVVYDVIEHRENSGERGDDLLQMFLDVEDADTGERMTRRQLRDEVLTMLLAGHDTTANALAWTFYLLSKHPDVERRLAEEVEAVVGDKAPTGADLPKLELTTRVIKESLRLYPPAWIIGRVAKKDDVIRGVKVPAGTSVMLAPWVVHRHPDHWENPEGFDPDRFLPDEESKRHKMAYFPFAAGPRMCIGREFALMELKTIVPMIVARYRLGLVPGAVVEPEPTITLRPRGGVPMTLRPRVSEERRAA